MHRDIFDVGNCEVLLPRYDFRGQAFFANRATHRFTISPDQVLLRNHWRSMTYASIAVRWWNKRLRLVKAYDRAASHIALHYTTLLCRRSVAQMA
jgi:hypothetical protein